MWLPVDIPSDAFVVNVGDFRCDPADIEHRPMVNTENERITIAMFFNPRLDAEVGPAASLLNPANPAPFRRMDDDGRLCHGVLRTPCERKVLLDMPKEPQT
ncbi:hypothetical protein SAY87_023389 [Trapa incisa]|uniref:Uncharacterized protein n=1 Tax=Trapa incisa TaxID=236973 RepID=A0AAN7QU11_9MYRT|nr:hypothetical protein SAY87_023389 [Trapa incisa]